MKNDVATVKSVSSDSQGGYGWDEVWQPPETLQALVADGCETLIPELIALFKTDADSHLQAVDSAIVSGNLTLIREHMHSLKGCASQLGAGRMAAICERIESADSESLTRDFPRQLKELAAVYQRVARAMDASLLSVLTLKDCVAAG
jgi:HPt (histidine-containing phosphotransfer) domain-containing protein